MGCEAVALVVAIGSTVTSISCRSAVLRVQSKGASLSCRGAHCQGLTPDLPCSQVADSAQTPPDEASASGRTEGAQGASQAGSHGLPSAEELAELLADKEDALQEQQQLVRSPCAWGRERLQGGQQPRAPVYMHRLCATTCCLGRQLFTALLHLHVLPGPKLHACSAWSML